MGYQYNSAILNHTVDSSTTSYTEDVLGGDGIIAFGERCELTIVVGHAAGVFTTGRNYLYNPLMFAANQNTTPLSVSGDGYLLSVSGVAGSLLVSVDLVGIPATSPASQNLTVTATINPADTLLTIRHIFYATADLMSYLGGFFIGNSVRLQRADISSNIYDIAGNNVYSRLNSFFECYIYEADLSTNQPRYIGGIYADPFVRDLTNPSQARLSRAFKGKFLDNEVGNIQAFTSPTDFAYNQLTGMKLIDTATNNLIFQLARKANPFLDTVIDNNFEIVSGLSTSVQQGTLNTIILTIKDGTVSPYTVDNVALTLIDCTQSNFRDIQPFPDEYKLDRVLLPALDATASPNWLNSGTSVFGTPCSWVGGGSTVITAILDGSKLVLGHQYRIFAQLYDTAGSQVSTHVSPAFIVADLQATPRVSIVGTIETLDAAWLGNDLSVDPFERVKMSIACDNTLYPDFIAELLNVNLVSVYSDGTVITSSFNVQANLPVGLPNIGFTSASPIFTFECEFRPHAFSLNTPHASTHTWYLVSNRTMSNGQQYIDITNFEQRLTVRALDLVRIVNMRLLDYTDFKIAVITPINQLCQDDTKVVVEVEKSGAPDAKLVALFFTANPNTNFNYQVEEEETFATATTLPTTTSILLEDTEATFIDNKAYYVIDVQQLQQNLSGWYCYGALIYDI